MRVWVQPDKMAQLGVTANDVINALASQNNVYPAGRIGGEPVPSGQQLTYTVRTQGRLVQPEEFENIILRSNPDGSVLLTQVSDGRELGPVTSVDQYRADYIDRSGPGPTVCAAWENWRRQIR